MRKQISVVGQTYEGTGRTNAIPFEKAEDKGTYNWEYYHD
ncbi:unnamed protein product [marine sediment metagenome]|uniref:Uncharacterized protein n=1 Tax=marine sediment metagenome TaxID=412755 RepID=X1RQC7_9ZZZZ